MFTGNTAGLSPVNATGGQIAGSIAVFTSLNTALQVAGYPAVTDVTEYSVIPYYSPAVCLHSVLAVLSALRGSRPARTACKRVRVHPVRARQFRQLPQSVLRMSFLTQRGYNGTKPAHKRGFCALRRFVRLREIGEGVMNARKRERPRKPSAVTLLRAAFCLRRAR